MTDKLNVKQLHHIVERLLNCSEEDILIINGKAIVIAPASPSDVERILNGGIWD